MHSSCYCFFQAINCAERARFAADEKSQQFLLHLEDSWIAAAHHNHERQERPAEVIKLRERFKLAIA